MVPEKPTKVGEGKETVIDNRTIVTVILMLLLGMEASILFVHHVSIFRGLKIISGAIQK